MKPARIFLFIVAFLTFLVVAAFLAINVFSDKLTEIAFVPSAKFEVQQPLQANAYDSPGMWYSRPGSGVPDPARWQPAYAKGSAAGPNDTKAPPYAVFFIHPTSYLDKAAWNAPLTDAAANDRAKLFLKGLASPFNQASEIWAPRYRQAAVGAFLSNDPAADEALDAAYRDVEQAFVYFLNHTPRDRPIVLAGHSQGSLHLLRLLASRVAGTGVEKRIAAVYAIGWPVSLEHDLPKLGLPACKTADDSGCVVSWVSFAEPAETAQMLRRYDTSPGLDGKARGTSPILCTNPLSGRMGGAAPARDNRGTLVPNADLSSGELQVGMVPAHCDAKGILLIGNAPAMGPAVLPGNNYHVYDIPLFWRNLQLDVAHRVSEWNKTGH
ncbi:MAG: DUF3089 domain-containing protein [Candidatus Andeanibacterium colombiense]|uniref:DUF3089 domain-containing protein n=1 Tax=Candidatus Andeanibacterium colombiense TaxID=3121345 RepID=A0AAJ5X8L2_9SPHN|nr:MAG: DUF3089 domain-containing protein [Sphingomonadaceae bacterium]